MEKLTDDMLLESYQMAKQLHLDEEFITLLLAEIYRRDLALNNLDRLVVH